MKTKCPDCQAQDAEAALTEKVVKYSERKYTFVGVSEIVYSSHSHDR